MVGEVEPRAAHRAVHACWRCCGLVALALQQLQNLRGDRAGKLVDTRVELGVKQCLGLRPLRSKASGSDAGEGANVLRNALDPTMVFCRTCTAAHARPTGCFNGVLQKEHDG